MSGSVHPRVCGELRVWRAQFGLLCGSSPRVRGTRRALPGRRLKRSVHPRVCGELRGRRAGVPAACRFIPACAGNSLAPHARGRRAPVHPRVCGELRSGGDDEGAEQLVHPRVCGELRRRTQSQADRRRFIPACAGNSPPAAPFHRARPVHPRVCGELQPGGMLPFDEFGSSPRVRGTQMGRRTRRPAARFIPACAGNSTVAHATPTIVAVHPRVCGELTSEFWRQRNRHGSSPRVRGTRPLRALRSSC